MEYFKLQIKVRDIRQNKSDRIRNISSIQQCPDCGFYDKQTELLQPGQSYEVLRAASKESPIRRIEVCHPKDRNNTEARRKDGRETEEEPTTNGIF